MAKKILARSLVGIPVGIAIGFLITICISLGIGDGEYTPCIPSFVEQCGNEINAVLVQTALSAVVGIVFGASSVIWEIDKWSIAVQTGVYFVIVAVTFFPISYFAYWMEHSVSGFLSYFAVFAVIFVVIWIFSYAGWRAKINKMNKKLNIK